MAKIARIWNGSEWVELSTSIVNYPDQTGNANKVLTTDGSTVFLGESPHQELLNHQIDNYWTNENQELIREQSEYFNKYYNWERRAKEWNRLFEILSDS